MTKNNPSDSCCLTHDAAPVGSNLLCPSCGSRGKAVKQVTIDALVTAQARSSLKSSDGFRFCPEPTCDMAYFHPGSGDRVGQNGVKVKIGLKQSEPPRIVCYCFDHTAEAIESEARATGTSGIQTSILEKCRQGLDRCEETNPQGSCCLGNVRRVVDGAIETLAEGDLEQQP